MNESKTLQTFEAKLFRLAFAFHQCDESLEVMLRIVRTRRGFRMVLNGHDGERFVAHAFDALVVEIDVSDFDFRRQAVALDRETVIVRSDLDVTVAKVFDGLVAAAMTKRKFESFPAKRASQQLMTKTNAESRDT